MISDDDLIDTFDGKYRINPQLLVTTDLELFDHLYEEKHGITDERNRIHKLKRAVRLYKGRVYPDAEAEHWLMAVATDYHLRFLRAEEELLALLSIKGNYQAICDEAKRSLCVEKGNKEVYYWMTLSLIKQGTTESARQVVKLAKNSLTEEDYAELLGKIEHI